MASGRIGPSRVCNRSRPVSNTLLLLPAPPPSDYFAFWLAAKWTQLSGAFRVLFLLVIQIDLKHFNNQGDERYRMALLKRLNGYG